MNDPRPSSTKSSRSRVLESAHFAAQQRSVLADVEATLDILEGESASMLHQIADLRKTAEAIRAGLVILDEVTAEFQQTQEPTAIGKQS